MAKRNCPRISHFGSERRFEHFARIHAREFLPLAILERHLYVCKRFKRPTKPPPRFLGSAGHPSHFSFRAREQRDHQIGFAKWIRAQNNRFRFLEWHASRIAYY